MLIRDFYANREIFITGGSGYLGKSLIEKLLRDCPKVKVLYLLLRDKATLSAEKRLEELKKSKIFDRIREECPEVLDKLRAIPGDSMKLGLGITLTDMELLKNVSIIFHMAANVRFDDPLRSSILLNTRGTYELVKIAEKLKNLIAFLHCSTAYSNALEKVIEEKVYKMPIDWRSTIKIAETCDEATLDTLFIKYSGNYPNTYTFTKNLTEQLIDEYSNKLPIVISRPSIVLCSYEEPVPGYLENMNGPIGALILLGIGLTPVIHFPPDIQQDSVPLDYVSRATLVLTYKRGLQTLDKVTKPNSLEVYNIVQGDHFLITMRRVLDLFMLSRERNPMENTLWRFEAPHSTGSDSLFLFYMFFINIPFSIILDTLMWLAGHKPLALKMQRRLMNAHNLTKIYKIRQYAFSNEHVFKLDNIIPLTERQNFAAHYFLDKADAYEYFRNFFCGIKQYLLNQPAVASKAALKRYRFLKYLNKSIKYFLYFSLLYYLWSVVSKL